MKKMLFSSLLFFPSFLLADESMEKELHFSNQLVEMAASLIGIVGIAIVILFIIKKFLLNKPLSFNSDRSIKIIEKKVLGPKSILYMIQVQNNQFLISDSPSGARLIAQIPFDSQEKTEAASTTGSSSFADILKNKFLSTPLRTKK